jgi:CRISPR-associated protein Csm2
MNQFNKPNPGFGGNRGGFQDRPPPVAIDPSPIKLTAPLSPQLFSEMAEKFAEQIANGKKEQNKPTQIRKFYDELVMWHDRTWTGEPAEREKRYQEHAPFIRMLTAKVAYAEGRGHVDKNFQTLFNHCIRAIDSADTLRNCKLFIEAFMGFYKAYKN